MDILVSRAEAARILGVSDSSIGRIRAGNYPEDSDIVVRHGLLMAVLERARGGIAPAALAEMPQSEIVAALCRACPREDCTGCRGIEI